MIRNEALGNLCCNFNRVKHNEISASHHLQMACGYVVYAFYHLIERNFLQFLSMKSTMREENDTLPRLDTDRFRVRNLSAPRFPMGSFSDIFPKLVLPKQASKWMVRCPLVMGEKIGVWNYQTLFLHAASNTFLIFRLLFHADLLRLYF